ncbi:fibrous sheath CABYR-binding protein [Sesbania bispinosa]|nr:fibrous sheath CABYR-binding protein [Sesbania bispinosa]
MRFQALLRRRCKALLISLLKEVGGEDKQKDVDIMHRTTQQLTNVSGSEKKGLRLKSPAKGGPRRFRSPRNVPMGEEVVGKKGEQVSGPAKKNAIQAYHRRQRKRKRKGTAKSVRQERGKGPAQPDGLEAGKGPRQSVGQEKGKGPTYHVGQESGKGATQTVGQEKEKYPDQVVGQDGGKGSSSSVGQEKGKGPIQVMKILKKKWKRGKRMINLEGESKEDDHAMPTAHAQGQLDDDDESWHSEELRTPPSTDDEEDHMELAEIFP